MINELELFLTCFINYQIVFFRCKMFFPTKAGERKISWLLRDKQLHKNSSGYITNNNDTTFTFKSNSSVDNTLIEEVFKSPLKAANKFDTEGNNLVDIELSEKIDDTCEDVFNVGHIASKRGDIINVSSTKYLENSVNDKPILYSSENKIISLDSKTVNLSSSTEKSVNIDNLSAGNDNTENKDSNKLKSAVSKKPAKINFLKKNMKQVANVKKSNSKHPDLTAKPNSQSIVSKVNKKLLNATGTNLNSTNTRVHHRLCTSTKPSDPPNKKAVKNTKNQKTYGKSVFQKKNTKESKGINGKSSESMHRVTENKMENEKLNDKTKNENEKVVEANEDSGICFSELKTENEEISEASSKCDQSEIFDFSGQATMVSFNKIL